MRKPLSEFIRSNGIYQSTAKLSGEIHAGCFMYHTSWTYLLFRNHQHIQVFTSSFDLSKLERLKQILKTTDNKLALFSQVQPFVDANWKEGTFDFERTFSADRRVSYTGNFRTDLLGDEELIVIGTDNSNDIFKFIEFAKNPTLEVEVLRWFLANKYLKYDGNVPMFSYTDIEAILAVENLHREGYLEVVEAEDDQDNLYYLITAKGKGFGEELNMNVVDN
jgi:hypothetical protein